MEVDIRAELHECDKVADIVRELVRSGKTRDAVGVIEEMHMPIAERLIVEEDESVYFGIRQPAGYSVCYSDEHSGSYSFS